jgi:hypothetical protein
MFQKRMFAERTSPIGSIMIALTLAALTPSVAQTASSAAQKRLAEVLWR